MAEILCIEFAASEGAGGGHDRAVPIGKSMGCPDLQGADQDGHGHVQHLEPEPGADKPGSYVMGKRVGPAGARCLDVKLLKHLNRQRAVGAIQKFERALALGDFVWGAAD